MQGISVIRVSLARVWTGGVSESMFAEVLAFLEGKQWTSGHPEVAAISINRYMTLIWFLPFSGSQFPYLLNE